MSQLDPPQTCSSFITQWGNAAEVPLITLNNQKICFVSANNRDVSTINCNQPAPSHENKARLCYCSKSGSDVLTSSPSVSPTVSPRTPTTAPISHETGTPTPFTSFVYTQQLQQSCSANKLTPDTSYYSKEEVE